MIGMLHKFYNAFTTSKWHAKLYVFFLTLDNLLCYIFPELWHGDLLALASTGPKEFSPPE